jgi:hypothetical protein
MSGSFSPMVQASRTINSRLSKLHLARTSGGHPSRSGLVAYLCRSDYSFRLPGVRRPGGFYLPKLNAFGAGYRSR